LYASLPEKQKITMLSTTSASHWCGILQQARSGKPQVSSGPSPTALVSMATF